jgi:hypothetical protein
MATATSRGGRAIDQSAGKEDNDTFTRPTDTTPYTNGDVIAKTVSISSTTALRSLDLAFAPGRPFWLTFLRLVTNLTTFTSQVRVHFYRVSDTAGAPNSGTALVGDNVAFVQTYDNVPVRIGHVDLPVLVLQHASGDDCVYASREDLMMFCQPAGDGTSETADSKIYYRLEVISGAATPSSGQSFTLCGRSVDAGSGA